ncbi:MAG TPA: hypothetical protein VMS73_10450 [Anaerolineaceae bacterium]|nr:hypothetical protein [Anaerolineaceae bacterium]
MPLIPSQRLVVKVISGVLLPKSMGVGVLVGVIIGTEVGVGEGVFCSFSPIGVAAGLQLAISNDISIRKIKPSGRSLFAFIGFIPFLFPEWI